MRLSLSAAVMLALLCSCQFGDCPGTRRRGSSRCSPPEPQPRLRLRQIIRHRVLNRRAPRRPAAPSSRRRTVSAEVVAIAQPFMLNRMGAAMPSAVIFALKSDVDATSKMLRDYKRARPLVLRANMGDCVDITLSNWLAATGTSPSTRQLSLHAQGMQLVDTADKQDCKVVDASNNTVRTVPMQHHQ